MQLDKLVQFHKIMGDPTRIRILVLLSNGPKHGQALAGMLGLTPPTISHHLTKLKEINIVKERRDKNTVYFHLHQSTLEHYSEALVNLVIGKENTDMKTKKSIDQQTILENFLTKDGRLKTIPAQRKKKLIVLYHIAKGFETGRKYPENEVNEHIKKFHEDFATIRREFIMNRIMYRENGNYELNPKDMWATIE
ncbi:metalloregulator ArsR/SmtB family transcription factor [Bacillus sp. 165]|uniref:DUF2087 domain-containing protein n=1 Tax=Bacillus sp. 165 TaxID=1529117 RepID=UPI001AD9C16F|nr:metalloregulator ArsR/SmtB family transcription factor [Bacillus sp. 165]MBO9129195.1 metalloregulator ArsR/SmtB family transcription factor [Bacillus sp. 165]